MNKASNSTGVESTQHGQVTLRPEAGDIGVAFDIGDHQIDVELVSVEEGAPGDEDHVYGRTLDRDEEGGHGYFKIPRKLHEARVASVVFYRDNEELIKAGAKVIPPIVGAIAVGSLVVHRIRNPKS